SSASVLIVMSCPLVLPLLGRRVLQADGQPRTCSKGGVGPEQVQVQGKAQAQDKKAGRQLPAAPQGKEL
ncbi:MAG: hypothetical protein ACK4Z7_14020, partial [Novosphingobium sp.]